MTAKYTPGPWFVKPTDINGYIEISAACLPRKESPYRPYVCVLVAGCSCYPEKGPTAEELANARLIASAPRLLAACQAVVADEASHATLTEPISQSVVDELKAAIAQATGEP